MAQVGWSAARKLPQTLGLGKCGAVISDAPRHQGPTAIFGSSRLEADPKPAPSPIEPRRDYRLSMSAGKIIVGAATVVTLVGFGLAIGEKLNLRGPRSESASGAADVPATSAASRTFATAAPTSTLTTVAPTVTTASLQTTAASGAPPAPTTLPAPEVPPKPVTLASLKELNGVGIFHDSADMQGVHYSGPLRFDIHPWSAAKLDYNLGKKYVTLHCIFGFIDTASTSFTWKFRVSSVDGQSESPLFEQEIATGQAGTVDVPVVGVLRLRFTVERTGSMPLSAGPTLDQPVAIADAILTP